MMLIKQGLPDEGDLLLCTVSNIQFHSVFVRLDEFGGKTAMIHISEIAPGRIRNIREHVRENKKIVCKVLRIHPDRGHVDLSLRRVTENQKRIKINQIKQEQKAEKIVEIVAQELKIDPKALFAKLADAFVPKFGSIYPPFEAVVKGDADVTTWGLTEMEAKSLETAIRTRIKESAVSIMGEFKISTLAFDGVEVVKKALMEAQGVGGEATTIRYHGAGRYGVAITAENYKDAELTLKKVVDTTTSSLGKNAKIEFTRAEK